MSLRHACAFLVAVSVYFAPAPVLAKDMVLQPSIQFVPPSGPLDSIEVLLQLPKSRLPIKGVIGLERLSSAFRVYAQAAGAASPMAGDYEVLRDRIRFTPRYPLQEETAYAISFNKACLFAEPARECAFPNVPDLTFTLSADVQRPPARVIAIEPLADRLPANVLRFYIHFNEPMADDEVYDRISLVRSDGTNVPSPFLNLSWNLWDQEQKRLTVLFDPGRIKRGVGPNLEVGPQLIDGETYAIKVGPGLRDAQGRTVTQTFEKVFVATAPVHERLDPTSWTISAPTSGSRDPLQIATSVQLDSGSVDQEVSVLREGGERISGSGLAASDDFGWQFVPDGEWVAGRYRIEVRTELEDVSGNSVQSALDVKGGRSLALREERLVLNFEVKN